MVGVDILLQTSISLWVESFKTLSHPDKTLFMLQKTFGSPSLKNIDVAIPPNDTVFRQLPKLSFRLVSVDVYIHAFRYMMAIKCGVLGAASQVITDNFRLINDSALSPRIYGFCISFFIRKHNVVVYGTEFIELTKIFYFGLRHSIFA